VISNHKIISQQQLDKHEDRNELGFILCTAQDFPHEAVATQDRMVDVRIEGFTAVTMKNGVFWDGTPRGSCKNGRFGGN
jgi:hypothetical protein